MIRMHRVTKVNLLCAVSILFIVLHSTSIFADVDNKRWEFTGYLSAISANGGPISSSVAGSLGITRFDRNFSYTFDASVQRYSERVIVRRDTGLVPTEEDLNPVVDSEDLRYTVRSLPGPSNVALTVKYQRKNPFFYFIKAQQGTDLSSNLTSMDRYSAGVGYDIYRTSHENMTIDLGIGHRTLAQELSAEIDESIAIGSLSYRNSLGPRSELTTHATYENGSEFQFSVVKFGLHFWMTENLAIALVNETRRYSDILQRPNYIDNGSSSVTSFNMVFKKGAL